MITSNREKQRLSAQKGAHRRRERARVVARFEAGGGRCEWCHIQPPRYEVDHLFSRGHLLAEPWCSLAELCAALCPECHRKHTTWEDPDMVFALRSNAVGRLCRARGLDFPADMNTEPLHAIREVVGVLSGEAA